MTDLSFVFHVNTPNNEDVEPLLCKNWLAVADGMGGSGCMRHRVDRKFRASLARVLDCVLPEYRQGPAELAPFAEGENSYLSRIFLPCMRDEINTSALWASRIVMARFLFYILAADAAGENDPDDIKFANGMAEFIRRGLTHAKEVLRLTVDNAGLSVLPSTFAALHHSPVSEGECLVHALWAGDSRCYVLDAEGLRKLSEDDEDESKLLTNYFSADAPAKVHCRAYRLKAPFVLLCASDGFFDAYDKYGLTVEAKLLEDILACSSARELKEKLVERYRNNLSDDTSVAFVPVGFSSYEEMRRLFVARQADIAGLYAIHRKYAPVLSLVDRPEFRVTASICDRFEMKFEDIVRTLAQTYYKGKKDVLLTDWWKEAIAQCEAEFRQEFSRRAGERREQLKQRVSEQIEQRGVRACFRKNITVGGWLAGLIEGLRAADDALGKARARQTSLCSSDGRLLAERQAILRDIRAEQRALAEEMDSSLEAEEDTTAERRARCSITFWLNNLSRIEMYLFDEKFRLNDGEKNGKYKRLFRRTEEYHARRRQAAENAAKAKADCAQCEKEYRNALRKVREHTSALLQERRSVLAVDFIVEMDMDSVMYGRPVREEMSECVSQKLAETYGRDAQMIADTLEVYKRNPGAVSCIDFLFPASKLSDFRLYYRCRDEARSEKYAAYRTRLAAYEEGTDSLLHAPVQAPSSPEAGQGKENNQDGGEKC